MTDQSTKSAAKCPVMSGPQAVPPQKLVERTIVDVSALGVKLAYPDASVAVCPARDR